MSCDNPAACAPQPVIRNWVRVAKLGSADAAKGRTVVVPFKEMQAKVGGRHRHVRALRIRGVVKIAGGASHLLQTRHNLLQLIDNIQLDAHEGHRFLSGLDGRDIELADYYRGGLFRARNARATAIAANSNQTTSVALDLVIDLAGRVPGPVQAERLIPVAALQARESEAFKFDLRSTFRTTTLSASCTVSDYYQADGTTLGIEVWSDVVDLEGVNVPPKWFLRNYERAGNSQSLDFPEATHLFAIAANRTEDDSDDTGEDIPAGFDGLTVTVGGQPYLNAITAADLVTRDAMIALSEPESAMSLVSVLSPAFDPGLGNSAVTPKQFMLIPPSPRKIAPAGRVTYELRTNPKGSIRVLHEGVLCGDPAQEGRIRRATGTAKAGVKRLQQTKGGDIVQAPEGTSVDVTGPTLILD